MRIQIRINDLFDFIRPGIALSLVFLAVSGYLIFNPPSAGVMYAGLASFFLACGAYGYNAMADREEDSINRRVSPLAFSRIGAAIVLFSFAVGVLFSYPLGRVPLLIALASLPAAVAYSLLRMKKYLLVKNFYTGLAISQAFVFGAGMVSPEVLMYYFAVFLFFFIGSIISDLRDYEGDRKAGVKTIPVRLGPQRAKKAVYFLFAILFAIFLKVDALALFPLLLSVPIAYFLVSINRPRQAHFCMGASIFLLMLWAFW